MRVWLCIMGLSGSLGLGCDRGTTSGALGAGLPSGASSSPPPLASEPALPTAPTSTGVVPPLGGLFPPPAIDAGPTLPPKPVGPGAATLETAASWGDLVGGNLATTFAHATTTDILVRARSGPSLAGHAVVVSFLAPSGGLLAAYPGTLDATGTATFDVKLAGTFVGRNQQTGTFELSLDDPATRTTMATTILTLTGGVK